MSTPNPVGPTNLEQQRKLAKELIRAARAGDAAVQARIRAVRVDAGAPPRSLKLADAQLAVAREGGFDSWPKLVADLQERDVKAFREAVRRGDTAAARQLLASRHVRARIDDPMFDFGQRAAHVAAKDAAMLSTVIAAGADVNLRSDWANGPYTVLDNSTEDTARFLLTQGATLTPNVAARLGWLDELRQLVTAEPALVHARGGDGQQPLHEARPSRLPTSCWTTAPASTCAVSTTTPPPRSTHSSSARKYAGDCSSAAPPPTSSWPPGSGMPLLRPVCWTVIRPASVPASTSQGIPRSRRSTSTAGRSVSG